MEADFKTDSESKTSAIKSLQNFFEKKNITYDEKRKIKQLFHYFVIS